MQYTIACNNYYKNQNEEKSNEVYNNKKNKIGRDSFSFAPKKNIFQIFIMNYLKIVKI